MHFKTDPRVAALRDKLLYCDYLDIEHLKLLSTKRRYKQLQQIWYKKMMLRKRQVGDAGLSVLLDNSAAKGDISLQENREECEKARTENGKPIHMPYARVDSYETTHDEKDSTSPLLNKDYKNLYEKYLEAKKSMSGGKDQLSFEDFLEVNSSNSVAKGEWWKVPPTWLSDFEQYDDALMKTENYDCYGTPDPLSTISSVPCGGCGALLHCKDPRVGGYVPSELFLRGDSEELKFLTCQRCHFLKVYNASLEVKVSVEDYPELLSVIKRRKCAILMLVDLTDFPCSIWPNLKSIMHPFTPVFLVGNKVDLLPRDCPHFFDNIKKQLVDSVVDVTGIKRENVTHVALTSAKTGYGIEELINKLQYKWGYKGDVYLIGCTNVGKSSMFNALLQSDYCKVQAIDLVPRATISSWPGTTLNLLKFPILNPNAKKRRLRMQRLQEEQICKMSESQCRDYQLKMTQNMKYAILEGSVGRTFTGRSDEDVKTDPFSEMSHSAMLRKVGLDESRPEYRESRWCYDTPGTLQRDQILDLLTTDELMVTLPEGIISPRTFILRPSETVFVAGMGRLDFVEGGDLYIRCTLFTSKELPITMCYTADADDLYGRLINTEAFVVPANDPERLKVWPRLESKEVTVTGVDKNESVADVVLSSIGWIAITPHEQQTVTLRAWTPQGRGIYLRTPALLKKSVALRGFKLQGTPLYSLGYQVYVK